MKNITLYLAIILLTSISAIAQSPSFLVTENPPGTYNATMEFPANGENTDVSMSETKIVLYVPDGANIILIDGASPFSFVVAQQYTAADQNGGCNDISGETRGIIEMVAGTKTDLNDVRAGATLELFSFTTEFGSVASYSNGNSDCIDEFLSNTSTFDPDGDAGPLAVRGIGMSNSTILPVELSSFIANKKNEFSLLSWETASEINNDFFDVERSANGKSFEKIGNVIGNGTTTEVQNYEFLDRAPLAGLNYYRLKQVDFNGDYEYSKIETVDFRDGTEGDIKVFPNPALDYVNISLDRKYDAVKVTNQLGQLVETFKSSDFEDNNLKLNVVGYAPGVYFIEAKLDSEIVNKQFVRVK